MANISSSWPRYPAARTEASRDLRSLTAEIIFIAAVILRVFRSERMRVRSSLTVAMGS